jgi:alpha-L-fucosidase
VENKRKLNERTMTTRRDFLETVGTAAALSALSPGDVARYTIGLTDERRAFADAGVAARPLLALQQDFVDMRLGLLANFNMSTFQDTEWANPAANASVFAPTGLEPRQWATAARSANMTWGCLSVKHHDGFCLWPTATDSVSVRHAGAPDVVRMFVDAFRAQGLRVGLQFSMLDQRRRIEHFSVTAEKIATIKEQLRELLTHYGEITVIIFEGWNAPWARITYDELPFDEIHAFVKSLQPNCLVCELNSERYPGFGLYYTDLKAYKQTSGMNPPRVAGVPGCAIANLNGGMWFWHPSDLNAVPMLAKTAVDEWIVPFNARQHTVLLNAPPGRNGRLAPNLVRRLAEIGRLWRHPGPAAYLMPHTVVTTQNLLRGRPIAASRTADAFGADLLNDGEDGRPWVNRSQTQPSWAEIDLGETKSFNTVSFTEFVGRTADYETSRVTSFAFKRWDGSEWIDFARGTTARAGTILAVPRVSAQRVRFELTSGAAEAWIGELGVYDEPVRIT